MGVVIAGSRDYRRNAMEEFEMARGTVKWFNPIAASNHEAVNHGSDVESRASRCIRLNSSALRGTSFTGRPRTAAVS
jgi:hypothetical protein